MARQSRISSALETVTSTAIGYAVAVISQLLIFPFFDIEVTVVDNFMIAAWFTVVSIIRGYLVRRWFEGMVRQ